MYSKLELQYAAAIIKQIAKNHGVPEEQVRADMMEAMNKGRTNQDPAVQARWKSFYYAGIEPTLEEFVLWTALMAT